MANPICRAPCIPLKLYVRKSAEKVHPYNLVENSAHIIWWRTRAYNLVENPGKDKEGSLKGMRKDILKYCKGCSQCTKHRVEKRKFIEQTFKPGAQPMEFISMDLVGEFHPPSSKGEPLCTYSCLYVNKFCVLYSFKEQVSQQKSSQHGEIILHFHSELAERCWWIMELNLKIPLFTEVAKELGLEKENLFTTIQTTIKWCIRRFP